MARFVLPFALLGAADAFQALAGIPGRNAAISRSKTSMVADALVAQPTALAQAPDASPLLRMGVREWCGLQADEGGAWRAGRR